MMYLFVNTMSRGWFNDGIPPMMRTFALTLALVLGATACWAAPSLVILDSQQAKMAAREIAVIRELDGQVFAVAEALKLSAQDLSYTVLDPTYESGRYVFVRLGQPVFEKHEVLWQDGLRALIKLERTVTRAEGGQELLERPIAPRSEARPPSHLDDPALDAWLQELADEVNEDSLYAYVVALASYNRYARWTSNDDAADWIKAKFESFGIDSVYFHTFTTYGSGWSRTVRNVVAVIPGTGSPDSIVVIGGHMDATSDSVSVAVPGADDNASGTAGAIEAARLLVDQPFRHTLMFVGFNGEEQGLYGSEALANLMASQGKRVAGMLNMDMISYSPTGTARALLEGFYSGVSSEWLIYALRDNLRQFTSVGDSVYGGEGWGSDHVSFHDAGYPAVMTIEDSYAANTCYHKTCDVPSRVNRTFMREIAAGNIVTMAELARPLGSGSISGHVTLEGTTDYSGVLVQVVDGIGSDTADVSGAYQIADLLPGTYSLAFSRAGWVPDTLTSIGVTEGNETPGQDIYLAASSPGSISGTITLSGGSGVLTDAIVYVGDALSHVAVDGSYLISPLYLGEHVVTAALDGYALGSQVVTLADGENRTGVNIILYTVWDFEASNYGLDNQGTGWGWGTDATAGYHSATKVWGTVLGGNYANCGDYRLLMPPVCLAHLDSVKLVIWHWYIIEPNGTTPYDGANVTVAPYGTSNWQVVQPVGGYPASSGGDCNPMQGEAAYAGTGSTWTQATFYMNSFIGQTIRVRYHLGADGGVTRRGWYLDDVALLAWHSVPNVPPDPVDDLTIFTDGEDLILSWSAVSGATSYSVFRGTSFEQPLDEMELLNTQSGTGYTDEGASEIPTAFYVVTAGN